MKPIKSLQLLEVTTASMQKPSTQHTIQKVFSITYKSSRILYILARFKESTSMNMTDSVTILLQFKLLEQWQQSHWPSGANWRITFHIKVCKNCKHVPMEAVVASSIPGINTIHHWWADQGNLRSYFYDNVNNTQCNG